MRDRERVVGSCSSKGDIWPMTLLQTLPAANRFYAGSRLKRASSRAPSRDPVKVTLKLPRLDPSTSLGMTGPLKEFSPFAGQLVKADFDCELPSGCARNASGREAARSEEHTSELQSLAYLV